MKIFGYNVKYISYLQHKKYCIIIVPLSLYFKFDTDWYINPTSYPIAYKIAEYMYNEELLQPYEEYGIEYNDITIYSSPFANHPHQKK